MRLALAGLTLLAAAAPGAAAAGTLTLSKSVTVVSDPYNGMTSPARVPGAVLEYTLVALDPADSVTDLVVTDVLPGAVQYVANSLTVDGVAEDDDASDADASPVDGDVTAGTVTVRVPAVAAGTSVTIRFRVTIE